MSVQCQAITVLGIGGISTFWKNLVQVTEKYFMKFGLSDQVGYAVVIKVHWALTEV